MEQTDSQRERQQKAQCICRVVARGALPPVFRVRGRQPLTELFLKTAQHGERADTSDDLPEDEYRQKRKTPRPESQNGREQSGTQKKQGIQNGPDEQGDQIGSKALFDGVQRQRLHLRVGVQLACRGIGGAVDIKLPVPCDIFPAVLRAQLHLCLVRLAAVLGPEAGVLLRGLQPVFDVCGRGFLECGKAGEEAVRLQKQPLTRKVGEPCLCAFYVIARAWRAAVNGAGVCFLRHRHASFACALWRSASVRQRRRRRSSAS